MNDATSAGELDYRWAPATAISGTAGVVAYITALAVEPAPALAVVLVFAFAFGITVSSIGLYHILGGATASPLLLIATVANVVAAGELLAMVMIQMTVTAMVGHDTEFKAIWLGLDVAWDLYVGAGTVLFGLHLFLRRQLGAWLSLPGMVIGGVLLVFNIATFPIPPVKAGLSQEPAGLQRLHGWRPPGSIGVPRGSMRLARYAPDDPLIHQSIEGEAPTIKG